MKLAELYGYELHLPMSGGKAGKGYQKTSSIQVRRNNVIVKQFRFKVDGLSTQAAFKKAKDFIINEETCRRI
jgi:hypothetical protein